MARIAWLIGKVHKLKACLVCLHTIIRLVFLHYTPQQIVVSVYQPGDVYIVTPLLSLIILLVCYIAPL
jgi:hypothetical protein